MIVAVPPPTPVASAVALIVAIDLEEEDQVKYFVRSYVVPSSKNPVAVNWTVPWTATVIAAGVTLTEVTFALLTVSEAAPLMAPEAALMVALPTDVALANPVRLTLATFPLLLDQLAVLLRFRVEPSLYTPVAVNCWVSPAGTCPAPGDTVIDRRVCAETYPTAQSHSVRRRVPRRIAEEILNGRKWRNGETPKSSGDTPQPRQSQLS